MLSLDGKSSAALLLDLLRRRRAQCTVEQEYQNLALAITETYGAETEVWRHDVWRHVFSARLLVLFQAEELSLSL